MVHHEFYEVQLERAQNLALALHTPKGRGVFTTKPIAAGTVIDVCPVLVLTVDENVQHVRNTQLYHYTYNWPTKNDDGKPEVRQAVVFGLGSMFNHSSEPNVVWQRDLDRLIVVYTADRDIQEGEELCISYGSRLWFKDVDAPQPVDEGDGTELLSNIQLV